MSDVCLTCWHGGHLSSHNTLHSQVGQSSSHQTTCEGQILQRESNLCQMMSKHILTQSTGSSQTETANIYVNPD